jgi:hypothetical protein
MGRCVWALVCGPVAFAGGQAYTRALSACPQQGLGVLASSPSPDEVIIT